MVERGRDTCGIDGQDILNLGTILHRHRLPKVAYGFRENFLDFLSNKTKASYAGIKTAPGISSELLHCFQWFRNNNNIVLNSPVTVVNPRTSSLAICVEIPERKWR